MVKKFSIDPKVNDGDISLKLDWIPTISKVRFTSNVNNFEVFDGNGKKVSKINDDYYVFDTGVQEVFIRKSGYRPLKKSINVDPLEEKNKFKLNLLPEFGAMSIETFPPGMDIYVDGEPLNKITPFTIDSISVGQHEITLKMEGYRDSKKNIYVEDNLLSKVYIEAEKAMGYLYVSKSQKNITFRSL